MARSTELPGKDDEPRIRVRAMVTFDRRDFGRLRIARVRDPVGTGSARQRTDSLSGKDARTSELAIPVPRVLHGALQRVEVHPATTR